MSTMTLNLPMTYVEVDRDEMEYVEGGTYMSNGELKSLLAAFGLASIYSVGSLPEIIATLRAGIAIIRAGASAFGGPIGLVISAYISIKAGSFIAEVGQALDEGKGINYGWGYTGPYIYCD
ncbi:MAG: hypothetical protein AB6733_20625 [Clostridiaceae bacterium]